MEFEVYLRFLAALVFVLALIVGIAWLGRRYGMGGRLPMARGKAARLAVIEAAAIDAKRRLVLVRRDDTEHLLLLGANADLVIEPRIPAREARFADALDDTGEAD